MRRRLNGPATASLPPQPRDTLVAWARGIFHREAANLAARAAILRDGEMLDFRLEPMIRGLGSDAVSQAAAVLTRTADDDDVIAILLRAKLLGFPAALRSSKGLSGGWSALLLARSRAGGRYGHVFQAERFDARQIRQADFELPIAQVDEMADWTEPHFAVDPASTSCWPPADSRERCATSPRSPPPARRSSPPAPPAPPGPDAPQERLCRRRPRRSSTRETASSFIIPGSLRATAPRSWPTTW